MKILILSCNTGEGHNSAGKAVMEAALLRGHEVEFMDLMLLGGKTVSHMVGGAYISIVRHIPAFFSLLYKVGGLISSSTRKSPVYYANSLLAGRLDRYIKEHSFDLILTPHLYAARSPHLFKASRASFCSGDCHRYRLYLYSFLGRDRL